MPDFFRGVFDTDLTQVISITVFLLCVGGALVAGLLLALAYMVGTRYTKSFVATLALLPAVVCVIIMMVNGNIGTGVAVAGTFNLVRFRSVPGSAKEIGAIFLAMGTGLVMGMGYWLRLCHCHFAGRRQCPLPPAKLRRWQEICLLQDPAYHHSRGLGLYRCL